jgi:hypothetical protein
MIQRFLSNKQAITLLCANDPTLPKFNGEDWATISALEKVIG